MSFEPDDGGVADVRSPSARRMDELGVLIDRIVAVDRELAVVAAARAVLIDQARAMSEADAAANVVESAVAGRSQSSAPGWSAGVVAHRELVSEIACALRIPEGSAETLIVHSRVLVNDLPATFAALSAGEVSYRHVQKLVDHALTLPRTALAVFEGAVLPLARELTVSKFDRRARIVRERSHPESITVRFTAAREQRNLWWDPASDGMAYVTAYLPAVVAVAGVNRIDEIATALKGPSEARTQAQLRADVFGDVIIDGITDPAMMIMPPAPQFTAEEVPALAEQHLAELERMGIGRDYGQIIEDLHMELDRHAAEQHRTWGSYDGIGHGITAKVMVTVPALNLLQHTGHPATPAGEPATLEGYGPIDPDTARQLAADAPSFLRILTHPNSGEILSVGRDSYPVPAGMKRWLQLRDGTCRHPGCSQPLHRCDIDHTDDWACGGETAHNNLAHLCKRHHQLKHHTRWRYEHANPYGTLQFTSPTGHTYTTRPTNWINPPPPT